MFQVTSSLAAVRDSIPEKEGNGEDDSSVSPVGEEGDPRESTIQRLAQLAEKEGQLCFCYPPEGIPIRSSGTLFYNAASSSLPGPLLFSAAMKSILNPEASVQR